MAFAGFLKYASMTTQKYNQHVQEHNAWKRSLEFYKQENALLKYRLSEIVDEIEGYPFLQTAEYFQNEFLLKDEIIKKLSYSLQSIIASIHKNPGEYLHLSEKNIIDHERLRQNIWQFEQDFTLLSKDFNQKISKSIS